MNEQDLAESLLARSAELEPLVSENKIVDDVLDGRTAIITRTSRKADQRAPGIVNSPIPVNPNQASVDGSSYNVGGPESRYLPKHQMESNTEYQKRLDMTPFVPEMPGILQSRQGALFRKPPDIDLPDALQPLLSRATCGGASLQDLIVNVAAACQIGGFAGVHIDRERLPDDVDPDNTSLATVQQRGLGRIVFAPYAAHQIRGYGSDNYGLSWVKTVECVAQAATWDEKPRETYTVRVIDRQAVNVWTVVKKRKSGRWSVTGPQTFAHGAQNVNGTPVVPFRLFHPFPARDGVGRSNLRASAEADVAATRMLSDLLFLLHMLAPILTLTTNRDDKEIADIGLGSSYLNILQGKVGDRDEEKLAFTQLDPIAVDRLLTMYEKLCNKARENANKSTDVGVSGPVQQSGISKAWTFKTGEERVLFLLANVCLQEGFQWCLDLAARMSGAGESKASIKFPESYDITGLPEQLAIANQAMPILAEYDMRTAIVHLMKRLARHVMGNASDTDVAASDAQADALINRDLRPSAPLVAPQTVSERVPVTESDNV